jgi:hypothetical protein
MRSALVVALLIVATAPASAQADCEAARCAVQSAIAERCPCPAETHGAYVRCVARAVSELAAANGIPARCKGAIKRCAARSTCGRPAAAVVCDVPRLTGTCAIGLGFCRHPDGTTLFGRPCSSDADCVLESRCRISPSAARCVATGGTVASRSSCCSACASPGTPCGPGLTCEPSELCVVFGPIGPGAFVPACRPVPAGCELDRSCGCVSTSLCSAPNVCHDVDAPGDVILCECAACV